MAKKAATSETAPAKPAGKSEAQSVKELRDMTGLGMMECKKILKEAGGDVEKAKDLARKRGQEKVAKVAGRTATEGIVEFYRHHDGKLGVMVELNSNTDFVARNEDFVQLAKDLAMHIAARDPQCVRREELDQDVVQSLKEHHAKEVSGKKPADIIDKIVEGKMRSWYEERVLMDQIFVKDESKTVKQVIDDLIAKIGENITLTRFARFRVGEHNTEEAVAEGGDAS